MQYMIKRTPMTDDGTQSAVSEYFDGVNWLAAESAARAFGYDEAVSRVIVLNVLDRSCSYEVIRCRAEAHGSRAVPASLADDIGRSLAFS